MDETLPSPESFAALTAAYAKRATASYSEMANVWWDANYGPKHPAKMQAATFNFMKRYPIEAFRDEAWVTVTMAWWKAIVDPAAKSIKEAIESV